MPIAPDKLQTPGAVSGISVADLYSQQRAGEEIETLLESNKPGAGPKAFAKGFAVGTAVPFAFQMMPWATNTKARVGEMDRVVNQAHLAHYLQATQGVAAKDARGAAAGLDTFLNSTRAHLPTKALETYVKAITAAGGAVTQVPPAARLPSPDIRAKVLEAAEESFIASGKKSPSELKAYIKSFRRAAKGPLMSSAMLGALAGLSAFGGHRARQSRLGELKGRWKRANQ